MPRTRENESTRGTVRDNSVKKRSCNENRRMFFLLFVIINTPRSNPPNGKRSSLLIIGYSLWILRNKKPTMGRGVFVTSYSHVSVWARKRKSDKEGRRKLQKGGVGRKGEKRKETPIYFSSKRKANSLSLEKSNSVEKFLCQQHKMFSAILCYGRTARTLARNPSFLSPLSYLPCSAQLLRPWYSTYPTSPIDLLLPRTGVGQGRNEGMDIKTGKGESRARGGHGEKGGKEGRSGFF